MCRERVRSIYSNNYFFFLFTVLILDIVELIDRYILIMKYKNIKTQHIAKENKQNRKREKRSLPAKQPWHPEAGSWKIPSYPEYRSWSHLWSAAMESYYSDLLIPQTNGWSKEKEREKSER